jgi:hypothetical protein
MKLRTAVELLLDGLIVLAMAFLFLYASGRFLAGIGTPLREGYMGTYNLNNIALGALGVLVGGFVTLKLLLRRVITRPLNFTLKVTQIGLFAVCLIAVYGVIYYFVFADSSRSIDIFKRLVSL